jgi:hypothetical protein
MRRTSFVGPELYTDFRTSPTLRGVSVTEQDIVYKGWFEIRTPEGEPRFAVELAIRQADLDGTFDEFLEGVGGRGVLRQLFNVMAPEGWSREIARARAAIEAHDAVWKAQAAGDAT